MHRYDQRVDRRADGGSARGAEGPVPGKRTLVDDNGVEAHAGDAVAAASGSSGEALPGTLQRKFESSLGADLSGVRVHRSAESQTAAQAVGARAYTLGRDIHFGAGQYDPSSPQGEHLLAHEVAHTVQQQGGLRRLQLKDIAVSRPNDAHETEADAAADAMVAGKSATVSGASTVIARKEAVGISYATEETKGDRAGFGEAVDGKSDELKEQWANLGGDKLMAAVRSNVAAWKLFRATPSSSASMPGKGLAELFTDFRTSDMTPALREYASRQLGPENLALLTELISLLGKAYGAESVFNVEHKKINHKYEISFSPTTLGTTARMMYTNDLPTPWKWGPVSMQLYGLSIALDPLSKKKVNLDTLTIDGHMKSKPGEPQTYWGWKDFAGLVKVMGMPSGGIDTPIGGASAAAGVGVTFTNGELGDISFDNVGFSTSHDVELLKSKKLSVHVKLVEGGTGKVSVSDACDVKTAAISTKAPLVDATKTFQVRITMFENGSAMLPTSGPGELQSMLEMIRRFVNNELVEPRHAEALKQQGIDPVDAFRPMIEVQGWASMRWVDAKSDSERDAKNQQLSEERARNAAEALMRVWGPWTPAGLDIKGMGSGISGSSAGSSGAEAANDARAELKALQAKLAEKRKALKAAEEAKDAVTIGKLREEIDALQRSADNLADLVSPTGSKNPSNDEWIRQALIRITWKGKLVDLGAASAPTPAPAGSKLESGMY